ncbi:MAG: hypothetical protein N2235_05105 [Fischerella sp.]|nr:hypothetical protein [Fischerella sp.]
MTSVAELATWIENHLVRLSMELDDTYTMEFLDREGLGPFRVTGENLLDCIRLAREQYDVL